MSRPVELLLEGSDGEGDGEEVPSIDSPCEPAREEHGTLEGGEHRGELEGVEGSAIAFDATLLLGRKLEQAVRRVNHDDNGEKGMKGKGRGDGKVKWRKEAASLYITSRGSRGGTKHTRRKTRAFG